MRGTLFFSSLFIAGCSCSSAIESEIQKRSILAALVQFEAEGIYFAADLGDSIVYRWPDSAKNHLRVWIESDLPYHNPEFTLVAQGAFRQWVEAGAPVSFIFVSSQDSAQVRVFWVETLPDGNAGWAVVERDKRGNITSVELRLALRTPPGRWFAVHEVRKAALHEVGHAIGLGHPDLTGRIMARSPVVSSLTLEDVAAAKVLYALPPGATKRSLPR